MNDPGFVKVLALELYGSLYDRQSIAQTVRDFERILAERLGPLIEAGQKLKNSYGTSCERVSYGPETWAWDAALKAATEERSK